jgi:hypothetical protein
MKIKTITKIGFFLVGKSVIVAFSKKPNQSTSMLPVGNTTIKTAPDLL